MTKSIPSVAADFGRQLAASIDIGDTTFTLNSLLDADGVALIDAELYGFTIDSGAKKEYVVATLSSGTFTGVKSISRQGAVTTGFTIAHRVGAPAQITNHAALYRVIATLLGTIDLDAGVALKYDGAPMQTAPNALATIQFVLDTVSGGAVSFNATTLAGSVGENVTSGDWVYFKQSDGLWYLTDADDSTKSVNVKIGKVRATTTSGNSVVGGIFVNGQETVGTYVAGTVYYLSNTAGALATSAGTNSVIVGVGDDGGDLVFTNDFPKELTPGQIAGLAAGATFGTPSSINKFITQEYNSSATGLPVVRVYSPLVGSSTSQFDITNPAGTTFRYTWDGTGTDPVINATTFATGYNVNILIGNALAVNNGSFTITGSGTNYFEVTNASGVAENNKTISSGYLQVYNPTWTKPTGLKYAVVEVQAGGGGGGGTTSVGESSGGGGGGGYSKKLIAAASLGATETITVGKGGAGGVQTGGTGETGGISSFGAHATTTAGAGGTTNDDGGAPGTGSGGDLNIPGGTGGSGHTVSADPSPSGAGGASMFGFGGASGNGNNDVTPAIPSGYGGGGGGAHNAPGSGNDVAGGIGAPGVVIVTEYYS